MPKHFETECLSGDGDHLVVVVDDNGDVVFRTSGQSPRKHRSVIGGPGTARALRDYLTSVLDSAPATPAPAPAPTPAPAGTVTIAVRADLSALAADLRAAADAIAASQA